MLKTNSEESIMNATVCQKSHIESSYNTQAL